MAKADLLKLKDVGPTTVNAIMEVNQPSSSPLHSDGPVLEPAPIPLEPIELSDGRQIQGTIIPSTDHALPDPEMSIMNLHDYDMPEEREGKALYVTALKPDTADWLQRFAAIKNAQVLKDPPSLGYAIEVAVRQIKQQQPLRPADLESMTQKV